LLPLGFGTRLSALLSRLASLGADSVTIAPDFDIGVFYERAIREIAGQVVRVASRDRLREQVSQAEPSDEFVLIDSRLAAADEYAVLKSILHRTSHDRAQHLLAPPPHDQAAAEFVQLARDGTVERIRRYYDGVTRAGGGAVVASAVSAAVLHA